MNRNRAVLSERKGRPLKRTLVRSSRKRRHSSSSSSSPPRGNISELYVLLGKLIDVTQTIWES